MARILSVALLVLASCPLGFAQESSLPKDLASLVPSDAVGLVVLRSAREAAQQLESSRVKAAIEGETIDDEFVLSTFLDAGFPGDESFLDATKPIALSFRFAANSPLPEPVFIVPAIDVAKLIESLEMPEGSEPPRQSGVYVAVSMSSAPAKNDKPSRLITGGPSGIVTARVDLVAVIEKFRPVIDMGFEQLQAMSDSGQLDEMGTTYAASDMIDLYLEIGQEIVDSAESLDAAIDLQGGDLRLDLSMRCREGSPIAKYSHSEKVDYRALAGRLDPSAALTTLVSYDQSGMFWKSLSSYDDLIASLEENEEVPEEFFAALDAYVKHATQLVPKMGRVAATSIDLDARGFRGAASYLTADPQALANAFLALMRDPAFAPFGVAISDPTTIDFGSVKGARYRASFDLARFVSMVTMGEDPSPEDEEGIEMAEKLAAGAFGKDGARFLFLTDPKCATIVMGGDDAWQAGLAKRFSTGGEIAAGLQRSLLAITDANPAMLLHVDIGRGLEGVAQWMALMVPEEEEFQGVTDLQQALGNKSLPASFYWGARGATWNVGAAIEHEGLLRLIKAVNHVDAISTRRDQVEYDLDVLDTAVIEYAAAHDGVLPDSLEQAVGKDEEGNPIGPSKDPWGRAYLYEKLAGKEPAYRIRTLGADGKEGGKGEDADREYEADEAESEDSGG